MSSRHRIPLESLMFISKGLRYTGPVSVGCQVMLWIQCLPKNKSVECRASYSECRCPPKLILA